MIKINLEDLSPQTAFPSSIGKEKELSLIVYNTLKIDFEKKDLNNFIIELLMSINEQSLATINAIFKYEADLLKNVNTEINELVSLNKINSFFENFSLESITVFSSLAQGIPEIKSNVHFREEIFKLSELLEQTVKAHIEFYKDLNQNDNDFEKINKNIYFLQNLLNMVKNYAIKHLKRLASEISSKMNIEDQVKVISRLININNGGVPLLLESKKTNMQEDTIEDAILIDNEFVENKNINNEENKHIVPINNESIEEIKKTLQEGFNLVAEQVSGKSAFMEEQFTELKKENQLLKESINELTLLNNKIINKFNDFIDNQAVLQKAIKEKYNISF